MIQTDFHWRMTLVLATALALSACEDDVAQAATAFNGPSATALAGSNFDKLFIANASADALQVLDMAPGIDDAEFVTGPSVFNPLLIPVGPNPVDLVASEDGRVVAVLDPLGAAVRLVDADSRRIIREADGEPYVYTLGEPSTEPVAFAPDPNPCLTSCLGRFFVSLAGTGQILTLSFVEGEDGFRLGLDDVFDLGGRPQRMSATSDGRFVFAADSTTDEVVRVDRFTGELVRQPVGAPPGDIAVSGDDSALLVLRPSLRDLLVFGDIAGSLSVFDADADLSPQISCLNECGEDATLCAGSHPATQALCAEPGFDGLSQEPAISTYPGVFLDVIPRRIAALSTTRGQEPLRLRCERIAPMDDEDAEEQRFVDEYAVVIAEAVETRQSTIRWISLRELEGGTLAPKVAENGFCNSVEDQPGRVCVPQNLNVFTLEEERDPLVTDYISPCPSAPDRNRFVCLNAVDTCDEGEVATIDPAAGVVIQPGAAEGSVEWRLEWEAPYVNSASGGGTLLSPGSEFPGATVISDENGDLTEAGVRIGDIVDILTSPRDTVAECADALEAIGADEELCNFERRVIGYEPPRDGREFGGLVLGGQFIGDEIRPLPIECFGTDGAVSYRVRVGDAFQVSVAGRRSGRAAIGELFGAGADTGQSESAMFRIRTDFTREGVDDPLPLDARVTTPACERYSDDPITEDSTQEERLTAMASQLQRDQIFRFSIRDRTLVQFAGRLDSSQGSVSAGSGPSSVIYGEAPAVSATGRLGYLFVTYETTDAMLIFRPARPEATDERDVDDPQDFRFLR